MTNSTVDQGIIDAFDALKNQRLARLAKEVVEQSHVARCCVNDGVRASLEAEGPLTRQQKLDLDNPDVVWENHGFGFRACVQQPPSIPECCDFGDDVQHTEDHDPTEDPFADDNCAEYLPVEDDFMVDIRAHEALEERCGLVLVAPDHIQLTIDARRIAKLEANCEPEDYMTDALGTCNEPGCVNERKWAKRREMAAAHRGDIKAKFGEMNPEFDELGQNDPLDAGDLGAGTRGEQSEADRLEMQDMPHSWQSERILSAQSASDMAKEDYSDDCSECGNAFCMGDCTPFDTPPEVKAKALAAFVKGVDADVDLFNIVADLEIEKAILGTPDLGGIPRPGGLSSPLRAVELIATSDGDAVHVWFENHQDMCQFLADRRAFSDSAGGIKDYKGGNIGLWYVAELNCGGNA